MTDSRVNHSTPELHGSGPASERRKLAITSPVRDPDRDLGSSLSTRNILTLELTEETGVPLASQGRGSGRGSLE